MKRAVLLLFILLLPLALAEETVLHDEWHEYHDFFQVDDDYFEVINEHYISSDEILVKTLIKKNQESFIITSKATEPDDEHLFAFEEDREFCEREGVYRFCVTGISFSTSEGARSDEGGRFRYGTKIKVYEDRPETALLELERTIPANLYVNEAEKITLRLKNVGAEKATNISFKESINNCFTVSDRKNMLPTTNGLTTSLLSLSSDEEVIMSYKITPTKYCNTTSLSATFSYDDSVELQETTKKDSLIVTWPYTISFTAGDDAKINQPLTLTYKVTNTDNKPLTARVVFKPDKSLQFTDATNLKQSGFNYANTVTIAPSTSETVSLSVTNKYTGEYLVMVDALFSINDHEFTNHQEATLSYKTDTITPSIVLSKTKTRSGEPITIGFYLHNEDEQLSFLNIEGVASSDFFNDPFTLKSIGKNAHENVIFKTYYLPKTTNITTHIIELEGTFLTSSNQEKSFYTQKEITVYPKNMSILLTNSLDKTEVKRGDNITVSVSVENIADSGSNFVQARDYYDNKITKLFGNDAGETYLYGGEERELYVYQLNIPTTYNKQNFTITSTLTAQGQPLANINKVITITDALNTTNETSTEETSVPDETSTPEEITTVDVPINDSSTPDETIKEDKSKEGNVLVRLINGIAEFFANFF